MLRVPVAVSALSALVLTLLPTTASSTQSPNEIDRSAPILESVQGGASETVAAGDTVSYTYTAVDPESQVTQVTFFVEGGRYDGAGPHGFGEQDTVELTVDPRWWPGDYHVTSVGVENSAGAVAEYTADGEIRMDGRTEGPTTHTLDFSQLSFTLGPPVTPDAPYRPSVTVADSQATVHWSMGYDGGSAVTSFEVTSSPEGRAVTVDGETTRAVVTGLTNGKSYTFTVKAFNSAGASVPSQPSLAAMPKADWERVRGTDRYDTAAKLSASEYSPGVDVVYIASGEDFPDALAGAALASATNGPVLLTKPNRLVTATSHELDRLNPERIVILGGTEAIDNTVAKKLQSKTIPGQVERVSGDNRYDTAARLSESEYEPGVEVVYIASGEDFADALTGAALAGETKGPILLTKPGQLVKATSRELDRLNPDRIAIIGGPSAIESEVEDALESKIATGLVERIAGNDRYETAAQVAMMYEPGVEVAYIASASDYPDALAGAANGPVVLSRPEGLPRSSQGALDHLDPKRIVILGGILPGQ